MQNGTVFSAVDEESDNTPACAEKTGRTSTTRPHGPDHPRMRGEDRSGSTASSMMYGSPPRARGRPQSANSTRSRARITLACAGKTAAAFHFHEDPTDHPRMRGEDTAVPNSFAGFTGSPPHARGRRWRCEPRSRALPAHPRMRGEDPRSKAEGPDGVGSPPHARGRPVADDVSNR